MVAPGKLPGALANRAQKRGGDIAKLQAALDKTV